MYAWVPDYIEGELFVCGWLGIYLSAVEELRGAFDDILRSGKGSLAVRRREHIGSGFTSFAIGVRG